VPQLFSSKFERLAPPEGAKEEIGKFDDLGIEFIYAIVIFQGKVLTWIVYIQSTGRLPGKLFVSITA